MDATCLGPLVLVAPASSIEFKRKQHAQAQKLQRDRMKSALDRMARMLATGTGGVHAGTASCGTKVGWPRLSRAWMTANLHTIL
jgi:hypothetical protein